MRVSGRCFPACGRQNSRLRTGKMLDSDRRFIASLHIQNDVDYGIIPQRRIQHAVIDSAIRPFDVEILLNEISAFAVDSIDEVQSLLLALAARQQAPHLVLSLSVQKKAQSIGSVSQKLLRAPAYDDAVSPFPSMLDHPPRDFHNGFTIDEVELMGIDT